MIKKLLMMMVTISSSTVTFANPELSTISSGNVSINQSQNHTVVLQQSQQAIIEWKNFNIGSQEHTHFQQPAGGVTLNRINPQAGMSAIYGKLTATGKIILINPAGIYFGPGSNINVGSLIASTANISNENFLAGKYVFDQPSPYNSAVVNAGNITAAKHGLIALIGTTIENSGLIQAEVGNVVLASGDKFTFDFYGDQLINFSVDAPASLHGKISNTGTILADGGKILVSAEAASGILDNIINMSGVLQANSVLKKRGEIFLIAKNGKMIISGKLISSNKKSDYSGGKIDIFGDETIITPTALLDASGYHSGGDISIFGYNNLIDGTINASGNGKNALGGNIDILGTNIHLKSHALITAIGNSDGGQILIGGNEHGAGPKPNASVTTIDKGSVINASATHSGHGGKIVVWSNNTTDFNGNISATGGTQNGNGGVVEVSSHNLLKFQGNVYLTAPKGKTGTLLLDPENIVIQTAATTPNPNTSVVTTSTLENALSNGNVIVQTGSSGNGTGDITVNDAIAWNQPNTLILSAYRNININASIYNHTAGNLILRADNSYNGIGTINLNTNVYMGGGGQVDVYYNSPNHLHSDNIPAGMQVGDGTQYNGTVLNTLAHAENESLGSTIVKTTTGTTDALEAITPANQTNTTGKNPVRAKLAVVTVDNSLEHVTEDTHHGVIIKINQEQLKACKNGASCTMNDFTIE